jgi:hypothetical protein
VEELEKELAAPNAPRESPDHHGVADGSRGRTNSNRSPTGDGDGKAAEPNNLQIVGQQFLDIGYEYWKEAKRNDIRGAVIWLEGEGGELCIYTRGEYREKLKKFITTGMEPSYQADPVYYFNKNEKAAEPVTSDKNRCNSCPKKEPIPTTISYAVGAGMLTMLEKENGCDDWETCEKPRLKESNCDG